VVNKRIWTDTLEANFALADGATDIGLAAAVYLAQEDLQIVGVALEVNWRLINDITAAGLAHCQVTAELSQHPQMTSPGVLARLRHGLVAFTDTGTVRAMMWFDNLGDHIEVMFPESRYVSLKDGETVNLHVYYNNDMGGIVTLSAIGVLYFTKKA